MSKVKYGKSVYGMMRYLKRVADGHYQLKWQGNTVDVVRLKQGPFRWIVRVDGVVRQYTPTFDGALRWVDGVWGNEQVETSNLLNPKGGVIMIARKHRGGCCDPGTERYHTM